MRPIIVLPPMLDGGIYSPQQVSGTGTAEATNPAPFLPDRVYMASTGENAARVIFTKEKPTADVIPSTGGFLIPANSMYCFRALDRGEFGALFLTAEAADGSSPFEVTISLVG